MAKTAMQSARTATTLGACYERLDPPPRPHMKEPACAPQISTDKHSVSFTLMWQGASVTCVILRATLESDFWLPSNADDIRMLQVFGDGFSRIEAIAYRKLRAHPVDLLELTSADFAKV